MKTFRHLLAACLVALLCGHAAAQTVITSPPITASNLTPGYLNIDPLLLPHFAAGVASVRAGTTPGPVVIMGDSTTMGAGSGSPGLTGARALSYPAVLASLLNGYVTTWDGSMIGDQGSQGAGTAFATYDTRWTTGAGWDASCALASLGACTFHFATGAASSLTFTPLQTFDTVTIWYKQIAGNGSFTTNIDSAASLGTTNTAGATLLQTVTYSGLSPRGTHTLKINAANDGILDIVAIKTHDSTIAALDLMPAGFYGSKVAGNAGVSGATAPMNVLTALAPILTIVCLTINDSNAPTAIASYTTDLQTIITTAKASGDVILMTGVPSNTTQATNGTLAQFVAVNQALAQSNGVTLIDLTRIFGSYAQMNPIIPYFDTLHPTKNGYLYIADIVFRVLAPSSSAGSFSGTGLFNLGQPLRNRAPIIYGGMQLILPTTVAGLPTCNAAANGTLSNVTDATTPTYNAALTGGGAISVPVFCDGVSWKSH